MIKIGTQNITSIYKGTEEIVKAYKGLDLVFNKTTPAPVVEYVTDGLTAHFSGYDDYVDGAWVDRVSGYKFTPVSTTTAPVYDSENKLYEATQFGGMKADFTPETTAFTLEFVARDIKNLEHFSTSSYATFVGTNMSNWDTVKGISIYRLAKSSGYPISIAIRNNTSVTNVVRVTQENLVDNGLDTFAIVPSVGIFRNGEKISDCSNSITLGNISLFTNYGGAYVGEYRGKGKVHAVRYYNRALTAEEVKHNYETDLSIYEE